MGWSEAGVYPPLVLWGMVTRFSEAFVLGMIGRLLLPEEVLNVLSVTANAVMVASRIGNELGIDNALWVGVAIIAVKFFWDVRSARQSWWTS